MPRDTKKPKSKERQFLHDLATPLAIASGFIEAALDEGTSAGGLSEAQKSRLEKAQKAMERIREMMANRRAEIMAENETEKDP